MDNHDENSWNGTINERFGDAQRAFAAYLFTVPGVPLLYNGQEAGLDKRLEFFERDPIVWKESDLRPFYTTLVHLRTSHPALRHGTEGGSYETLSTGNKKVIAYKRVKEGSEILVILNMSDKPVVAQLRDGAISGRYRDIFTGADVEIARRQKMKMEPWGYMVLVR